MAAGDDGESSNTAASAEFSPSVVDMLLRQQPLILLAAAAALGIFADAAAPLPDLLWLVVFTASLLCFVWQNSHIRFAAIIVACVCLFALRHSLEDQLYQSASILDVPADAAKLDSLEGAALPGLILPDPMLPVDQPVIVEAVIDSPARLRRNPRLHRDRDADRSPWRTQLEVRLQQIRSAQQFVPVTGRARVMVEGDCAGYQPGDLVRIYGMLSQLAPPTNPGERDFRGFYRRQNLHVRIEVNDVDQIVLLQQKHWTIARLVATVARSSREILFRYTGPQSGPLAIALVIGQRDLVDTDTRDSLLVTGTAHLLSVSGLHLAIIVVMARWLAVSLRFPLSLQVGWVLSVCVLYTAITGGRPPVVRAAVLVAALMIAVWIRRPSQPMNTLALAALILLFANPELLFSTGVHLSFLAVATLLTCGRQLRGGGSVDRTLQHDQSLDALVDKSRPRLVRYADLGLRGLGRALFYSGCVTVMATPLVWHQFHVVSPISVLTNVLLGPLLFVALASGVVTVIVGMIAGPVAIIPGAICDWSLHAMRSIISVAASIPLGHFWLPSPPTWLVMLFYAVIAALMIWRFGPSGRWMRRSWIAVWLAVSWWISTTPEPLPHDSIEATFVDVGHGTSVIVRTSPSVAWLYDCGRMGNDAGESDDIDGALWALGLRRLQGIMLSHADADHFNALPGLLEKFSVGKIVTPPGMLDEPEGALIPIRDLIRRSGIPVQEVSRGDWLQPSDGVARARPQDEPQGPSKLGGESIGMEVLHPPRQRLKGSDNANSLVLRLDVDRRTLILPGDLEPPGTAALIRQDRPPPGGVLMAPHHGSLTMDAESVLQWARPRETVVSGGERARNPQVSQALAITGSGVYVTANLGAIRVRLVPGKPVEVRPWLISPW